MIKGILVLSIIGSLSMLGLALSVNSNSDDKRGISIFSEVKKESFKDDMTKSFANIVSENGFIFESHPIITDDGYKLSLFRIRSDNTSNTAPVVFC